MNDSGHRENGKHKPPHDQWLMQPSSMKQIMTIMVERDAAIHERNLALSEKKAALAERDMAIFHRDSAIAERDNAIMERDNAIATLQYQENSLSNDNMTPCLPECQISGGVKNMHYQQQHVHHQPQLDAALYSTRDMHTSDTLPMSPTAPEPTRPRLTKRGNETRKANTTGKKTLKSLKKVKRGGEDLNTTMLGKSNGWKRGQELDAGGDDLNRQLSLSKVKPGWKDHDLGLNQIAFDESTIPVPVCSCTGVPRTCYKWGKGGWQSSCCTTSMSMYPLPVVPNKRHTRVGGRKMSGSAFNKLLSRLTADGHDLSNSVDLKDHWAKHGTNRYITIK